MSIPTYEPREFVAGSTVQWTKSLDDYPASEWTFSFHLRGPGSLDAEATPDGDDFAVTLAATATALEPGTYYWQTWVTKDAERFMVGEGQLEVKAGLNVNVENFDGRSKAKQILDAIDALIAGKATLDQQEYAIGNRQLKRIPIPDLITLRKEYARIYARELRRARVRRGGSLFSNVKVRFDTPK